MKKSRLKRKSKSADRKLQDQLWELCKQITRKKYGNKCYTCGKDGLEGSGWHTGHMLPKASVGAFLKYDLRILRPQCYYCNINLGGNGAEFYRRMILEVGSAAVNEIILDKQKTVKASDHYAKLLIEYQGLLNPSQ